MTSPIPFTAILPPHPLDLAGVVKITRTIPTRVGRTHQDGGMLAMRTDHPHAGGENSTTQA